MVYFREDGAGGWTRLETRLGLNNLKFCGSKVPTVTRAVPEALRDLADLVISQGAVDAVPLLRPLTFTKLIKRFESKGLIRPTVSSCPTPPAQCPQYELSASSAHIAAHRAEVTPTSSVKFNLL